MKELRVVGYCRTSTDKQDLSIEVQEKKIRAYCEFSEYSNITILKDHASAKSFDRPAMKQILEMIKAKKIDVLVIYKLDRLTRSIVDLNNFVPMCNDNDVSLYSIQDSLDTKSATGRLVMNMLATVSQWEREVISERTREALQQKKSNGKRYCSNAPFGKEFDADGNMVDSEKEISDFGLMQQLRTSNFTYGEICERLEFDGIISRSGKPYSRSFIGKLLKGE